MAKTPVSSLSLYEATPEQIVESRRRTYVEWGTGLTLKEYLARDAFTDQKEVSCDGSFRRDGVVRSKTDPHPKKVVCYGIASVFTPPLFRGHRYAHHMMCLLHWVLADATLLPTTFPEDWGAPPARVAHAGEGVFSALWSDIGPNFYKRCGPTEELDGWTVRMPVSTIWDVKPLEEHSSSSDPIDWVLLDDTQVMDVWEHDAKKILYTFSPPDDHQTSFSFLPHKGVAAFQHWRNYDTLRKRVTPPVQDWGIMAGLDTFATWTFEVKTPPKTLLITRLKCSPSDFESLLAMSMSIARKYGMEKVEVYNLPDNLHTVGTRLGGTTGERAEHLSAFKWYGTEPPNEVFPRSEPDLNTIDYNDHHDDGTTYTALNVSAPVIPASSLTAILPLTQNSLPSLEEALKSLLGPSQLREIILLCPHSLIFQARSVVREIVSCYTDCPDVRLQTVPSDVDLYMREIHVASRVPGWALILTEDGLTRQNNRSREILLQPPALPFPYGSDGVCFSLFDSFEPCIRRSAGFLQEAHHLLPPFVIPAVLATDFDHASQNMDPWLSLGDHVARSRSDGIGGVVFGSGMGTEAIGFTEIFHHPIRGTSTLRQNENMQKTFLEDTVLQTAGVFLIVLPTTQDLHELGPLLCTLQDLVGHTLFIFVHDRPGTKTPFMVSENCTLTGLLLSGSKNQDRYRWIQVLPTQLNVLIGLREDRRFPGFYNELTFTRSDEIVPIQLSRRDLPHTGWMGSLSLAEWQNWNKPRLDISIITNDRPHSLARLLTSLSSANFYGDTLDLRINLEQSADSETLKTVENLTWSHGNTFIHRRVVHGGLLPAVVESWYPRSNDTYGLLLEDDVELSPMFYAWAKMSLLRYSLYQQKNIELPPEGRRPFDARTLFRTIGVADPTTPYLSPIPCSWGAVYFPEHWREFHTYLSLRLSESVLPLSQPIVPNVRSNKWTRSWKKYFIELVYLRGYVMLYPNYPDYVSLSTNHLEVGSHVKLKDRTLEKQQQFIVPLMQTTNCSAVGILDLPGRTLPSWDSLPVLNLTGKVTTLESLAETGRLRRESLLTGTDCTNTTTSPPLFDAQQLLCTTST
ncbi:hypothetical protein H0H92_012780 [Tricholoma furcatifolium]|nr:hypothetical protein H0H92_012780 [Tricholoma furcatifolium]